MLSDVGSGNVGNVASTTSNNKFTNIRSWYAPNTTCLYKFTTSKAQDLISLEFLWFRVERVSLCQENVRIFDGPEADMSTLMTRLCDMNKPQPQVSISLPLGYVTFIESNESHWYHLAKGRKCERKSNRKSKFKFSNLNPSSLFNKIYIYLSLHISLSIEWFFQSYIHLNWSIYDSSILKFSRFSRRTFTQLRI
jgi:hypothetical protein